MRDTMASKDNWGAFLDGHPIFSMSRPELEALNLSINSLRESRNVPPPRVSNTSGVSRRRQLMCMKDLDLILAVDSEKRMASLGNSKASEGSRKSYRVCLSLIDCASLEISAHFRYFMHPAWISTFIKFGSVRTRSCLLLLVPSK